MRTATRAVSLSSTVEELVKPGGWSLKLKLAAGFGLVVAVFLVAMAAVLSASQRSDHAWAQTLGWSAAQKGVAEQIRSTQAQMFEQDALVATWNPVHMQRWEAAVALGDHGAAAVSKVHDHVIATVSANASVADHHHDDTVHHLLFPAFKRGDHAAALAALLKANRYVQVPYRALLTVRTRIDQLRDRDAATAHRYARRAQVIGLLAVLLGAVVAAVVSILIIRSVRRPIAALVAISEAAAAGDLTVRADARNDELGRLGRSFNSMIENLESLVDQIGEASTSVRGAAEEMSQTSAGAGRAIDEIAVSMGDIAAGAERQARLADAARTAADSVADGIELSATSANEASAVAGNARAAADAGVESATAASEAMEVLRESADSVTAAIRRLASKSEEIGGIVEAITGIAGQTNLLALNAAIEAARAGEQGRGFAVVAEEVRKLAEESEQAASRISSLIGEIQIETQRAVEVVDESARRSESGAATVEAAKEAFLAIGGSVTQVTSQVSDVLVAIEAVRDGARRMTDSLTEVTGVSEESATAVQQVSASTQQTTASTAEIVTSAGRLTSTAGELERLVARFRVVPVPQSD